MFHTMCTRKNFMW